MRVGLKCINAREGLFGRRGSTTLGISGLSCMIGYLEFQNKPTSVYYIPYRTLFSRTSLARTYFGTAQIRHKNIGQ